MGKESIIAQVDSCTEQIMKNISDGITSAIGDNLQDIKDDTKAIEDIIEQTEVITEKLSGFDGLSSSLADLKAFAEESKQLSNKITPLESQLIDLHEQSKNRTSDIKSCIGELQKAMKEDQNSIVNKVYTTKTEISQLIKSENESMKQNIAEVLQKLQEIDTYVHETTDKLNERVESIHTEIQAFNQQNEVQFNMLKESLEKVQVTLDIVVNLTTPFWKKWGK